MLLATPPLAGVLLLVLLAGCGREPAPAFVSPTGPADGPSDVGSNPAPSESLLVRSVSGVGPTTGCCEVVRCDHARIERMLLLEERAPATPGSTLSAGVAPTGEVLFLVGVQGRGVRSVALDSDGVPTAPVRVSDDGHAGRAALQWLDGGWLALWSTRARGRTLTRALPLDPSGHLSSAPYTLAESARAGAAPALITLDGKLFALYTQDETVASRAVGRVRSAVESRTELSPHGARTSALAGTSSLDRGLLAWTDQQPSGDAQVKAQPLFTDASEAGPPILVSENPHVYGGLHLVTGDFGSAAAWHVRIAGARAQVRFRQLTRPARGERWPVTIVNELAEEATDASMAAMGCGYAMSYRARVRSRSEVRVALVDEVGHVTSRLDLGAHPDVAGEGPTATVALPDGALFIAWLDREGPHLRLEGAEIRCTEESTP